MTAAHSDFDAIAERAVDRIAAADPGLAILLGIPGEPALTDYSPAGHANRATTVREIRAEAMSAPPLADTDAQRIGRAVLVSHCDTALHADEAGDWMRDINVLFSPPQNLRMTLEFAPGAEVAAELLAQLPDRLAGWRESLTVGLATPSTDSDRRCVAARRQALAVAEQLPVLADNWLPTYAAKHDLPADLTTAAGAAFRNTATWLADVYAPQADPDDAVGTDRYQRAAAGFNGMTIDLADTYDWGWHEVERLTAELVAEVANYDPDLPLTQVRQALDADPAYRIEGVSALREHLTALTATATERVEGVLFDIDPRVRDCGVQIAAEGSAAAPYYVPPSEDLSRPGSTWYPTRGNDVFPRWWLESVWFHEGVPGHHLQLGTIATLTELPRFSRVLGTTSGHAEGWALYAERLADEQGWFDTPGTRIGFLSAQLMRAVRVVVDIGLHTKRRIPVGFPGARALLTPDLAQRLLVDGALLDEDFAASEVDRYLGMPGQAISYKVGERAWLEARADAQRRLGGQFDLREWHRFALQLGPMGLDLFQIEMSRYARDGAVG